MDYRMEGDSKSFHVLNAVSPVGSGELISVRQVVEQLAKIITPPMRPDFGCVAGRVLWSGCAWLMWTVRSSLLAGNQRRRSFESWNRLWTGTAMIFGFSSSIERSMFVIQYRDPIWSMPHEIS